MLTKRILFLFGFLALSSSIFAQSGIIRGKVIDDASGEEIIGATALVKGTAKGAVTDFDGKFEIKVDPGVYDLQFSFISFETVLISNVEVKPNEVSTFFDIRLKNAVEELEAVVVSAELIRNSEASIMTVQKKSANLLDGVSAQTFRRIGDSDAAGAIRRVPGVSIQGGQYVFVRGLGDRYTKTVLNDMEIPGLDPDRNSIQIDIFPTNIINNLLVLKTFTPELSADFVGGTVNIETKDFPEEKSFNVSASVGYNPSMHLQDEYLTYEGGSTDFLGLDDGTRDLPFVATQEKQIPSPVSGNYAEVRRITQSFDPNMGVQRATSPMNYSLGLSAGNQKAIWGKTFGFNAALNYSANTQYYEDAIDAFYQKPAQTEATELLSDTRFNGPLSVRDVQLSGLLGGAIKTGNSKITLQGLHIQNGTERAAQRIRVRSLDNFNTALIDNLEYTERFLSNVILGGEHYFPVSDSKLEWKTSATFATINDKDIRITPFTIDDDSGTLSINANEGGEPQRIWRLLDEENYVGKLDYTKKFEILGNSSKFRTGISNVYKTRDFVIQDFFWDTRGDKDLEINGDPQNLLASENLINTEDGEGAYLSSRFVPSNSYSGRINIFGAYVSTELAFTEKLKTIVGVRAEQYDQFYTGLNQEALSGASGQVYDNDNVLSSLEFFPSVNLIYSASENMNLRGSYSRTIARPSFKELSTLEIQDVLTGTTFIGNIGLVETNINNYDLRWEYFFEKAQRISIGLFYKQFTNPIELVRQSNNPTDIKPENVGDATILGLEVEVKKNLEFVSPALRDFAFSGNFTFTRAEVNIDATELKGREQGLRGDQKLETTRDFLGQPPVIFNTALNYNNSRNGIESSLAYNVQGKTLAVVGVNRSPDTYEMPFHSLNFNISKSFGSDQSNTLGLRVTNILDDDQDREFQAYQSESYLERRRSVGREFRIKYAKRFSIEIK